MVTLTALCIEKQTLEVEMNAPIRHFVTLGAVTQVQSE
jgi:hypothetical protein